MPYYTLNAVETSSLQTSMPSEAEIQTAVNHTSMTGRTTVPVGRWVGAPRVTRNHQLFMPYYTYLVVALEADSPQRAMEIAANLKQQLDHMDTSGTGFTGNNWSTVSVVQFSEARNGPLANWENGQMSVTQTAETPPAPATQAENPVGPGTIQGTPSSIIDTVLGGAHTGEGLTTLLKTAGIIGAGVVGLYLLWPWLSSQRGRGGKKTRSNPVVTRDARRWARKVGGGTKEMTKRKKQAQRAERRYVKRRLHAGEEDFGGRKPRLTGWDIS